MRRTSKSVIAGILVSLATAAVSGAAKAAVCVSNTLDKYTAPGFTCTIGDMTFANFTWTPSNTGGGDAPPAMSEMAVPDGLGFDLDGLFAASSGATADAILHYTVTTTDDTNTICMRSAGKVAQVLTASMRCCVPEVCWPPAPQGEITRSALPAMALPLRLLSRG
jgi:hypothetical protein